MKFFDVAPEPAPVITSSNNLSTILIVVGVLVVCVVIAILVTKTLTKK